jgi:hypothetical protein
MAKSQRNSLRAGRLPFPLLSVLALGDAADGKIFIEVGPMKAKGRKLDVVQLRWSGGRETRIC